MNAPNAVLVTGASRFLGGFLTAHLARNPEITRVIGVDHVQPSKDMLRRFGRAEFVRADIRNPLIGKVIRNSEIDTVVHAGLLSRPPRGAGRTVMKDVNVLGAMQLFAVCQKMPSVQKVIVRSSTAVYGSSPKDPARFTEENAARSRLKGAFAVDCREIEGYARGLGRRRPDLAVTILRQAPMIGPLMNGMISRYLASPLVPTIFGRDARLQLLHEQDALAALSAATMFEGSGTFNIAAEGIVSLSQAIRRAGRVEVPLPSPIYRSVGSALIGPPTGRIDDEHLQYFRYGCGVDTTRMYDVLGFHPERTTVEAVDDFVRGMGKAPIIDPEKITAAAARIETFLGGRPRPTLVPALRKTDA